MRAFFLTLFLAIYFSVSAQIDTYQQEIINCLNINGTTQEYGVTYEELFVSLKERVASPETPESFWDKLKEGKEESIDELIFTLSFAYRKHFKQNEIAEMTEFYQTEAAQKLMTKSSNLTENDHKIIEDYESSDVAKKTKTIQVELSKDISNIVREWNTELFAKKIGAISKAGYSK